MTEYTPIHFFDEHIDVIFNTPPVHEKNSTLPKWDYLEWQNIPYH